MFKRTILLATLTVFVSPLVDVRPLQPAAPSLAVIPGKEKSHEALQGDDQSCQAAAQQAIGYQSPGEAANQAAVGSAAVGTALGALEGAAIG